MHHGSVEAKVADVKCSGCSRFFAFYGFENALFSAVHVFFLNARSLLRHNIGNDDINPKIFKDFILEKFQCGWNRCSNDDSMVDGSPNNSDSDNFVDAVDDDDSDSS